MPFGLVFLYNAGMEGFSKKGSKAEEIIVHKPAPKGKRGKPTEEANAARIEAQKIAALKRKQTSGEADWEKEVEKMRTKFDESKKK